MLCTTQGEDCSSKSFGKKEIGVSVKKKPAADFSARAELSFFDDATLPVFCPTRQRIL
jgi:hypothetical protein